MASGPVDPLQSVDVDEGEHEPAAAAARPIDLLLEGGVADLAAVGTGEIVDVGQLEGGERLRSGLGAPEAVLGRAVPILGGLGSVFRRLGAHGGGVLEGGLQGWGGGVLRA